MISLEVCSGEECLLVAALAIVWKLHEPLRIFAAVPLSIVSRVRIVQHSRLLFAECLQDS